MVITTTDILTFLYILVGIMLVVVLYNVLQLFVDVRRIVRRADRLTEQVESIVMKPLAMADEALGNIMALFEGRGRKDKKGFDQKKVR